MADTPRKWTFKRILILAGAIYAAIILIPLILSIILALADPDSGRALALLGEQGVERAVEKVCRLAFRLLRHLLISPLRGHAGMQPRAPTCVHTVATRCPARGARW